VILEWGLKASQVSQAYSKPVTHRHSSLAVQSSGGLVHEQDGGVRHQLQPNGQKLPLAGGNANILQPKRDTVTPPTMITHTS
jgi:hypothetical protein